MIRLSRRAAVLGAAAIGTGAAAAGRPRNWIEAAEAFDESFNAAVRRGQEASS